MTGIRCNDFMFVSRERLAQLSAGCRIDGTKTYFDTNVTAHHHFYLEHNHELIDIPDPHLVTGGIRRQSDSCATGPPSRRDGRLLGVS
jgi:hypothetical protein